MPAGRYKPLKAKKPAGARGPRLTKPQQAAVDVARAVTGGSKSVKKGGEHVVGHVLAEAEQERRQKLQARDRQARARYRAEVRQARRTGAPKPPPPELPSIRSTRQREAGRTEAQTRARYPSRVPHQNLFEKIVTGNVKPRGGGFHRAAIQAANLIASTPYVTAQQGAELGRGTRQIVEQPFSEHPSLRPLLYNKPALELGKALGVAGAESVAHPRRNVPMTALTAATILSAGRVGLRGATRGAGETRASLRTSKAARAATTPESFAGRATKMAADRRELAKSRTGVRRRNLEYQATQDEHAAKLARKNLRAAMGTETGQDLGLNRTVQTVRAVKAGVKAAITPPARGRGTSPVRARMPGPDRPLAGLAQTEQGLRSRRAPHQPRITVTPERRLYHGTSKRFGRFDLAKADESAMYGPGIYLTDNPRVASGYAVTTGPLHREEYPTLEKAQERVDELNRQGIRNTVVPEREGRRWVVAHEEGNVPHVRIEKARVRRPFEIHGPPIPIDTAANLFRFAASRLSPLGRQHFLESPRVKEILRDADHGRRGVEPGGETVYNLLANHLTKPGANKVLRDAGYDAITHQGGLITGGESHNVTVLLNEERLGGRRPGIRTVANLRVIGAGKFGGSKLGWKRIEMPSIGGKPGGVLHTTGPFNIEDVEGKVTLFRSNKKVGTFESVDAAKAHVQDVLTGTKLGAKLTKRAKPESPTFEEHQGGQLGIGVTGEQAAIPGLRSEAEIPAPAEQSLADEELARRAEHVMRIGARSAPRTAGVPAVRVRRLEKSAPPVHRTTQHDAIDLLEAELQGKVSPRRRAFIQAEIGRLRGEIAAKERTAPIGAGSAPRTRALNLRRQAEAAGRHRTDEELKLRLKQLDKAYKELVKRAKEMHEIPLEEKRRETAIRNRRRGKRKYGNLKTVNQEIEDAAVGDLERVAHDHPDLPGSKILNERQGIIDYFNAQAEQAFGPDVAEGGVQQFTGPKPVFKDTENAPPVEAAAPPAGTPPPAEAPPAPPTGGPLPPAEGPPLGPHVRTKVRRMLRPARHARKEQELLKREEKGRRMELAKEAMASVEPGSHAFYALKGQLKGEYPKVPFDKYRAGQITQAEHDQALSYIQSSHLEFWDQVHASQALEDAWKLGRVPQPSQIKLLQQVFGKDRANQLVQKTLKERGIATIIDAAGIPRSLMASFDVSAPFRQGLVAGARHPVLFFRAFRPMFQSLTSEEAYQSLMQAIRDHKDYEQAVESGVAFTDLSKNLTQREEQFISHMAESIPFVHWSGRAYTGFLDKLRMDMFSHQLELIEKAGGNIEDRTVLRGIAKFVNSSTGRGDLGRFNEWGPALNAAFFSPRLIASRINMLNPFWYASLPKYVRYQALRSAVQLGAAVSAGLGIASYFGPGSTQLDPRSADFLKYRIGDSRLDVLGGFQQYMRVAAQLYKGETLSTTTGAVSHTGTGPFDTTRLKILSRFAQSKLNPPVSYGIDYLAGTDFAGNPFEWKSALAGRLSPLMLQDARDIYKHNGGELGWDPRGWKFDAKALGYALAGFSVGSFGFGLQTYGLGKNKGRAKVFDTRQKVVDQLRRTNPAALTGGELGPRTKWAFNREAERQGLYWKASAGLKPGTTAYHMARLKADLDFIVRHAGYSRAKADLTLKLSEHDSVDELKATRAQISEQYYQGDGGMLDLIHQAKKAAGIR